MKKYIAIIITMILCGTCLSIYYTDLFKDVSKNLDTDIKKNNILSMMIETQASSGKYQIYESNEWPSDGYVLNTELSKCENGGTLSWDDINKKVVMKGNISDKCYVYFDIYVEPATPVNDYIKNLYTGTQGANGLYYHNSSLTNGAGDNSYRYAGGDYVLTSKATSSSYVKILSTSTTNDNALIDFYCDGTKTSMWDCNTTSIYFILNYDSSKTQYKKYKDALNKAINDGYVTKNNVNNFVCFGSNEENCPSDNLYRIIGIFNDKVKLIKWDNATNGLLGTDGNYSKTWTYYRMYLGTMSYPFWFYWGLISNNSATSDWSISPLNLVNLNTNYLNNIGTEWSSKIQSYSWKVPMVSGDALTPKEFIAKEKTSTIYSDYNTKVGLMYVSDYEYAASNDCWTLKTYVDNSPSTDYRSSFEKNWMYMGEGEWTLTTSSSTTVYWITDDGYLRRDIVSGTNTSVRPVFYLSDGVGIVGEHAGSETDPHRLR